jgi:hypothetical protein
MGLHTSKFFDKLNEMWLDILHWTFLTNMAAFASPLYSLPHSICTNNHIIQDAEFFLCGVNNFLK